MRMTPQVSARSVGAIVGPPTKSKKTAGQVSLRGSEESWGERHMQRLFYLF